jgi:SAM-dependent methyltransferase
MLDASMNEHLAANRELWDGWTDIHLASDFYDLPAFRAGASTLNSIELDAVGDVTGKSLLHLQCHFGLDTLSWARLGARTTGVDFSPRAIATARSLAQELKISAEFVCADVCELPAEWKDRYDIVFTSYGVLPWLPDLERWARGIARVLRPGGSFHLMEFHPLTAMLDDDGHTMRHPYFPSPKPSQYDVKGSYADPGAVFSHASFEWSHSLAEVQMALIDAGLTIREFREYPYSPYGCYPYLEEQAQGRWRIRNSTVELPLIFSIHATSDE